MKISTLVTYVAVLAGATAKPLELDRNSLSRKYGSDQAERRNEVGSSNARLLLPVKESAAIATVTATATMDEQHQQQDRYTQPSHENEHDKVSQEDDSCQGNDSGRLRDCTPATNNDTPADELELRRRSAVADAADVPLPYNPGGPMTPYVETTSSLQVAPATHTHPHRHQSTTTSTPSPTQQQQAPHRIRPEPPIRGCTATVTVPLPSNACSTDGTKTVYPSTTTVMAPINCHGCIALEVARETMFCPMEPAIAATVTAKTPSTAWSTVCAAITDISQLPRHRDVQGRDPQLGIGLPVPSSFGLGAGVGAGIGLGGGSCYTTYLVFTPKANPPTSTYYQSTTTYTTRVYCSGCSLVVSTPVLGPGGVLRWTVTLPVEVMTTAVCQ